MDPLTLRLTQVFREVFDDQALELRDTMVASDVRGWDSLHHVKLVVAIERAFAVKFSNREIVSWRNVGDMRRALEGRLAS
jgi:acyl carrier protein